MAPPTFVYGSLMWSRVLESLLGRVPVARAAILETGYKRCCVPGEPYPGLVCAEQTGATHGLVLTDLVDAERAILDAFEGDAYKAQPVEPRLVKVDDPYGWAVSAAVRDASALQLGEKSLATAYIWLDAAKLGETDLWEPAVHFAPQLVEWTFMCQRFAREQEIAKLRREADAQLTRRQAGR